MDIADPRSGLTMHAIDKTSLVRHRHWPVETRFQLLDQLGGNDIVRINSEHPLGSNAGFLQSEIPLILMTIEIAAETRVLEKTRPPSSSLIVEPKTDHDNGIRAQRNAPSVRRMLGASLYVRTMGVI